MLPINPLSGALAQSAQVQRQLTADKARQARRAQQLTKNTAARDEEMEHQVENAEELAPVHDDDAQPDRRRKDGRAGGGRGARDENEKPRLDLTA